MNVLQLVPYLHGGGVERGTLEIANALVSEGHRAFVISGGGAMVTRLDAMGVRHTCWPVGRKTLLGLRLIGRLRHFLRDQQIDVLHVRSRFPAWLAYLAWRSMPVDQRPRLVTTVHGLYSVNPYSAVMTYGERVIAVSESVRNYILANYPRVDDSRIRVIHRGIDGREFPHAFQPTGAWYEAWYTDFPQLRDRFVLTLPGRLTRLKGHHALIDVLAILRQRGIDAVGLVVGDQTLSRTSYVTQLENRAVRLGVDLVLAGHRSDMREVYAASDAVLSLSTKPESFGRTALEALSIGIPVVGYDHGGVGEILQRMFPEGAVTFGALEEVADVLVRLYHQPTVVADANPFPLENMLRHTLDLYAEFG